MLDYCALFDVTFLQVLRSVGVQEGGSGAAEVGDRLLPGALQPSVTTGTVYASGPRLPADPTKTGAPSLCMYPPKNTYPYTSLRICLPFIVAMRALCLPAPTRAVRFSPRL